METYAPNVATGAATDCVATGTGDPVATGATPVAGYIGVVTGDACVPVMYCAGATTVVGASAGGCACCSVVSVVWVLGSMYCGAATTVVGANAGNARDCTAGDCTTTGGGTGADCVVTGGAEYVDTGTVSEATGAGEVSVVVGTACSDIVTTGCEDMSMY